MMRSALPLSGATLHGSPGIARLGSWVGAFVIIALALAAAYRLPDSSAPGWAIRSELLGAAGELSWQIVADPTEQVRQAMRRHFREVDVEVDTTHRPNVLVTLRDLDRAACEGAVRDDDRSVYAACVALERPRSPADCGERNDMTWWIMP